MSLGLLGALIVAGMVGPLLRLPRFLGFPVAVGEILTGVLLGNSGLKKIPVEDPALKMLALVGFALLMMTAGSHIDYKAMRSKLVVKRALTIVMLSAALALCIGLIIGHFAHFENWKLLALISFSSSAAFVIPLIALTELTTSIEILIAQVTLADVTAFLLLPFSTQKNHRLEALYGSLIVLLLAVILFALLSFIKRKGWITLAHSISKKYQMGLELRISLGILLLVAGLALHLHTSLMVAGFSMGVVLASIGVPHRLARQLFAVSEGLFCPLYFIWLGASIDVRATFQNRSDLLLAFLLCLGAFAAHIPSLLFRHPVSNLWLSSAQLGIPAAAVTLGSASGILTASESGAIMLSALGTLVIPTLSKVNPTAHI